MPWPTFQGVVAQRKTITLLIWQTLSRKTWPWWRYFCVGQRRWWCDATLLVVMLFFSLCVSWRFLFGVWNPKHLSWGEVQHEWWGCVCVFLIYNPFLLCVIQFAVPRQLVAASTKKCLWNSGFGWGEASQQMPISRCRGADGEDSVTS